MNYSEVFRSLSTCPDVRDRIMETYRSLGGINHRWMQSDQSSMALAISKIEDEIEFEKKNQEHRGTLKLIRRELEITLETYVIV